MKLVPTRPPGPNLRKARAFAAEIWRLRQQGHTFESIREALAAAGVHVSNSTVQREVALARQGDRSVPRLASPGRDGSASDLPEAAGARTASPQDPAPAPDRLSGKDIAEAFMRRRTANPLIRAKEPR